MRDRTNHSQRRLVLPESHDERIVQERPITSQRSETGTQDCACTLADLA